MNAGGIRVGHPSRTVVSGPLAPYADGFREDLGGRGYAAHSISGQMRLVAHLSSWLAGQELPVGAVTIEVVADFLRVRRDAGHRSGVTSRALAPLLGYLRGLGVVAQPGRPIPETAVETLLEEFRCYLVEERGLAAASVRAYLHYAALFLTELRAPLDAAMAGLPAGQVTAFLMRHCERHSAWYAKAVNGGGDRAAVAAAVPAHRRAHPASAGVGGAVGAGLEGDHAAAGGQPGAGGDRRAGRM